MGLFCFGSDFLERRSDLQGHTFKVAYIDSPPYVAVNRESGELFGFMVDILQTISKVRYSEFVLRSTVFTFARKSQLGLTV